MSVYTGYDIPPTGGPTAPESLFWYWVAERHAIYLRRKAGQPKPWTTDPILRDYKFTNPFRENDRGTVWLRENFLEPHRYCEDCDKGIRGGFPCQTCKGLGWEPDLLAFNICWYRMFNWIGTGKRLGWQTDWPSETIKSALKQGLAAGDQIFTGAHMLRSEYGKSKVDCIVDVCTTFWIHRHRIVDMCKMNSLQTTFQYLIEMPYVGPFLAYEMVTDMRHTRLLEDATDIMTWANPGPGARRGLQRLQMPWKPDSAAIDSMQLLLSRSEERPNALPTDYPLLEMRDVEHSLCEFDKYCRTKFGEGRPRSRYPGAV